MASPQDTPPKLTSKQRAFIDHYVTNGFNGTRAAIAAGYAESGAHVEAVRLLKIAKIKSEIEEALEHHAMGRNEVLARLTDFARGDLGDIYNEDTGQIDWKKIRAAGLTHLVKKIDHTTKRTTLPDGTDIEIFEDKIELHDPMKAITLIGKQLGLFVDRTEVTGKDGGALRFEIIRSDDPTD